MASLKGVVSVVAQLKGERENLRRQLQQVDEALSVLSRLNGKGSPGKRRRLSLAARRRIAAAQRARWAKVRARQKQA